MKIPNASHIQFVVLASLFQQEASGTRLREIFSAHGHKPTRVSFYQLMGRLEEQELVTGRIECRRPANVTYKDKIYNITSKGIKSYEECIDFYTPHCVPK